MTTHKVFAKDVGLGFLGPIVHAKNLAPQVPAALVGATLPVDMARKLDKLAAHNDAKEQVPGSNMVRRAVKLGDLWDAGKRGVVLSQLADAEWLHMPPHPAAIPLEVFQNSGAGELHFQDKDFLFERGDVLLPGGTMRVQKVDFITVRAHPLAMAYGAVAAGAVLYPERDTAQSLGAAYPGVMPATDGRLFDRSQSFVVVASRDFIPPQEPRWPESMTLPAMQNGTYAASQCEAMLAAGDTIRLAHPDNVAMLHVLRQYRHVALVCSQMPVADYGGGVDIRGCSVRIGQKDGLLPRWVMDIAGLRMPFGQKLNTAAEGTTNRGQRFVLPLDDMATLLSAANSGAPYPSTNTTVVVEGHASMQWLLSKTPVDFSADAFVQDTLGANERAVVYSGPLEKTGKLTVHSSANTGTITVRVYAMPTQTELTDIEAAGVTPMQEEQLNGTGAISVTVQGGCNVVCLVKASATATAVRAVFKSQ